MRKGTWTITFAGLAAGTVTGLFGGGGGMILVPLLAALTNLDDRQIFSASICIILPVCLVCLAVMHAETGLPWQEAMPYLLGSILGGIAAGKWGEKIPVLWLHRGLGILIIWGGWQNLC